MAQSEHLRLFLAKNAKYDAPGQLINPDNFRVIYVNAGKKSGAGVGDLIIDDSEIGNLSEIAVDMPRRVWIYVSIGEVEELDIRRAVYKSAKSAGLIGNKNMSDTTGNINVRFWEPAWAKIVLAEMARCFASHKDERFIAGFMLDVCDAWRRPKSAWQ